MKYFIAHLLSGSAKAYHTNLTRVLAARFRIFPLHERVTPHITVKAPFETSEERIAEIERALRAFAANETAVPYTIRGFGHFGFRTIYMDVDKSRDAVGLVRRLLASLQIHAAFLPRYPNEGNKLHASVARFLTRVQKRRIMRFISGERPEFRGELDNVAILKKEGKEWKVMTVIPFKKQEPAWVSTHHAPAEEESLVYSA